MKIDTQTIVLCALFSVLCVATQWRWIASRRGPKTYSARAKWLSLLAASVLGPAFWLILNAGVAALPDSVTQWLLPVAPLVFLLFLAARHVRQTEEERQSQRRLANAILLAGAVLLAVCLIVFWPR